MSDEKLTTEQMIELLQLAGTSGVANEQYCSDEIRHEILAKLLRLEDAAKRLATIRGMLANDGVRDDWPELWQMVADFSDADQCMAEWFEDGSGEVINGGQLLEVRVGKPMIDAGELLDALAPGEPRRVEPLDVETDQPKKPE